ncbi:MAG: hypothetical protein WAW75_11645 [Gallionella sp.]
MKSGWAILILNLASLTWLTYASDTMAEEDSPPPSVRVGVYARHQGSKIVYHYRVINNLPHTIDAVMVGYDNKNDEDPNNDSWELLELPSGWHNKLGIPAASSQSPSGWRVSVSGQEIVGTHAILWETINSRSPVLSAGQTMAKMSVSLDQPDTNYLTGHALIHFTNRDPATLTVPLEQLDTTPPRLSVSLNPSTLNSPEGKLMPVNAIFTIKDDYDHLPEIKLESIAANEPLEPGDIRDASFDIDDRYIKLRAHHNSTFDRIYTVIYSATDASGNQTIATATATVPYDQAKLLDRILE